MKPTFILLLSLLAVLAAGSAPVHAADAGTDLGRIRAAGNGAVVVHATGLVDFRLRGHGVLVIRDFQQHEIGLDGTGEARPTPEGDLRVTDFHGSVTVRGGGIEASFRGGSLALSARGHGRALLRGHGHYRATSAAGSWTPDGIQVEW